MRQAHGYHLVSVSPWPILSSMAALLITSGLVIYLHDFVFGELIFGLGLVVLMIILYCWWRDVVREGTYEGDHTLEVQKGLRFGMILFIVSEVLFFFAFFWAFFHAVLSPNIEVGAIWPPKGIEVLDPFQVPLLNTVILLTSGGTLTWAHHAVLGGQRKQVLIGLGLTIMLGLLFTGIQLMEYKEAGFTIADGIYGSTFYGVTGLHGVHVIIGSTFLIVCWLRFLRYQLTRGHHFGFEAAAWYWHFVDVVWICLYLTVYIWGY
jgi:cytochrome c oxidase subunit 3